MTDHGDADGDGFLEYVDEGGHGLANQGWKDSGDSVQWRDGTLADRADRAVRGAGLRPRGGARRRGAARGVRPARRRAMARVGRGARDRFRASFWVEDADRPVPRDRAGRGQARGRHRHQQHRPPPRHRAARRRRGAGGRRAAARRRHELGLRPADHVDDVRRVLAAALPRRVGVGARHRDRRDRAGPQRARGRGRRAGRGTPGGGGGDRVRLPELYSGAARGTVPTSCPTRRRAGRRRGRRRPRSRCCPPRSGSTPTCRAGPCGCPRRRRRRSARCAWTGCGSPAARSRWRWTGGGVVRAADTDADVRVVVAARRPGAARGSRTGSRSGARRRPGPRRGRSEAGAGARAPRGI